MKRFLWIGAVADKDKLTELIQFGGRQTTAYNVQNKLIQGLEANNIIIDTISGDSIPSYPSYKKVFLKKEIWKRQGNTYDVRVGFLNLPLFNLLSKMISLQVECKKWSRQFKNEHKIIIVYALHTPYLRAANYIKKAYPNTYIYYIVPDLPEYMDSNMGKIKGFLKKIDRKIIDKMIVNSDGLILFAEPMKEKLPMSDKRYAVVEGIVAVEKDEYLEKVKRKDFNKNRKVIMFSGSLDCEKDIKLLLDSFLTIESNNYELWITGSGLGARVVEEYTTRDTRVKFFGYIDSYDELLNMQHAADLLVCISSSIDPKSRYFFPSKIMEYLVTGNPIICFKMECIPEEYDEHLFYFNSIDIEEMGNQMKEICNLTSEEKCNMAYKRYELLKDKSKEQQAKKIKTLIEESFDGEEIY